MVRDGEDDRGSGVKLAEEKRVGTTGGAITSRRLYLTRRRRARSPRLA